jgi:HK97 family phage major capsid protein
MATATNDLSKLNADDLRDKLGEVKNKVNDLTALESLDAEQEATLVDLLDEGDQLTNALSAKNKEDRERRLKRLREFDDKPNARKTGGNNGTAESFNSFGERLNAVAQFRLTGQMDPRLRNALGANESTPSDGGFLVGTDAENDLMSKVYGSPILSRIPRTSISAASNMLKLKLLKETSRADGSRQGGVQAYWEGEASSTTATQREYEELELTLKKLMAVSYASSELLEDHSALESETSAGFNEEMTFKVEDAVINGNGVGKPLGIINSPAKITVALETGQTTADPLLYENIVKMWARLHPRSQMNAIWLVDQTLIPYLMLLAIPVGTGGMPVYQPSNGAADAPFGTLLGRPVIFTEYTQAANTEGDIILWDPTSYRIIEKGGIRGASSVHVAFLTDETAFRFTYRVNGAPKWRSALTPKNGGATLSTIVTLTTRT